MERVRVWVRESFRMRLLWGSAERLFRPDCMQLVYGRVWLFERHRGQRAVLDVLAKSGYRSGLPPFHGCLHLVSNPLVQVVLLEHPLFMTILSPLHSMLTAGLWKFSGACSISGGRRLLRIYSLTSSVNVICCSYKFELAGNQRSCPLGSACRANCKGRYKSSV